MNMKSAFTKDQKKMLCLSSLGGTLEFYDFIIYIFLTPYIEQLFFADNSGIVASLKTLAIFSIGYLLRPLGGIVFSHFGDRYGRKVVFLLTVIFMAIPSLAIGLLPTATQIGVMAPILLLVCRMMQGLALGGEIPAAITFVSEHVDNNRLAFANSTLFFGINAGLLLGSLVTTIITSVLSHDEMLHYGWRIPFIVGGVFGLISIFLRRYLHETIAFKALRKHDVAKVPVISLLKTKYKQVLEGTVLVSIGSVTVFLYLYWPQYLTKYFHYSLNDMMRVNTLGTLILNCTILIGGLISDRIGHRFIYIACAAFVAIFSYPLFLLFHLQSISWVIFSYVIFSILFGFIPGTYSAMLAMLFPTSVRYSGIALCYNLAYAFVGGLSPIICTLLIYLFDSIMAPAFYLISVAICALITCYKGINTKKISYA